MKYLSGMLFMLKTAMMYPLDSRATKTRKILFYIWSCYYHVSLMLMVIQCIVYFLTKQFDIINDSVVVVHSAIYTCFFITSKIMRLQAGKMEKLARNINLHFQDRTDNLIEDITMDVSVKISDKLPIIWSTSCTLSALLISIIPLLMNKRGIPIPIWFPFDYTSSPAYELCYIWQCLVQINLGILAGVCDTIFPSITVIMGQQFRILGNNFKNAFCRTLIDSGLSREQAIEFSTYFNNNRQEKITNELLYDAVYKCIEMEEFQKANMELLKRNIKHQQQLLQDCDDINDIFQAFLILKIGSAIFYIVFIAFGIVTIKGQVLLGLISYILLSTTEILIYTYSGQILTQNADFTAALYECPWYLCDIKYKKSFLFVLMRTGKTVQVRAGGYFIMTAAAFITFMKAISSYVALLRELTKAQNTYESS